MSNLGLSLSHEIISFNKNDEKEGNYVYLLTIRVSLGRNNGDFGVPNNLYELCSVNCELFN